MEAGIIRQTLQTLADEEIAQVSRRFFKTGPGQYGEGDVFIGVRVPQLRKIAKTFSHVDLSTAIALLTAPIHEERLLALLILIRMYNRGDSRKQHAIYTCYLDNTAQINNWDLVDSSAEHIVGAHLMRRNKTPLHTLAESGSLWERRIAIMATFHYIKRQRYDETLQLAEMLLDDPEDLIHKAVGWMLREIGKRNLQCEEAFLKQHFSQMPRTMLRYAIERFPEPRRKAFLSGRV
jgi:3-methyladenine DNA glycosylase AlkD